MLKTCPLACLALWFAALAAVGAAPASEPSPAAIEAKLKALSARWEDARKQLELPALAVAVVRGDATVLAQGFGALEPGGAEAVTRSTPFYIASSTKPFTAMAVVMLAEEGKLDLDAPVKRYLPAFELKDAALSEKITVRDLLCHRYGLDSNPISFREAYSGQIDDAKFYELLKRAGIAGKFQYSNLHFTLAGRVIESVSGVHWKQFMEERIFAPAGMTHTTASAARLWGEFNGARPTVYGPAGRVPSEKVKSDAVMHAAGGLGASAEDLARWIRLNMKGGEIGGRRLLSEAGAKQMQTPQQPAGEGDRLFKAEALGLGWWIGKYGEEPVVFHHGGYVGARAHISFLPEKKWGVAALVTDSGPGSEIVEIVAQDVYDFALGAAGADILPETIKKTAEWRTRSAARPEVVPDADHRANLSHPLAAYAGKYEDPNWGVLEIRAGEKTLLPSLGDFALELKAAGKDAFQTEFRGRIETLKFEAAADGTIVEAVLAPPVGTRREFKRIAD